MVSPLSGISLAKEVPFDMDGGKDDSFSLYSYQNYQSRRQTFDGSY